MRRSDGACAVWEGVDITWRAPDSVGTRPADARTTTPRAYPLPELLRTIGQELEESGAQRTMIVETPSGFVTSADIDGGVVRQTYTHAELFARDAERRRRRGPRSA
jgi:hypothetical protein